MFAQRSFAARVFARLVFALTLALLATACVGPAYDLHGGEALEVSICRNVDASEAAVVAGSADDLFTPTRLRPIPLRAPGDRDSWARVRLTRDWPAEHPPVITVVNSAAQVVTVFVPRLGYREQRSRFAADQPIDFSHTALHFNLPHDLRAGDVVYVRTTSGGGTSQMYFTDAATAHALDLANMRWVLFTTTVLGVVFVANLSFVLIERRQIFYYFGGMIGGAYLYYAYLYGEGYHMPVLRIARELGSVAWALPATVAVACALLFLGRLMHLRVYAPRMYRAMHYIVIGLGVCFVVLLVAPASMLTPLYQAANLLALLAALSIVVSTLAAAWRGSRAARFVLVAWMPMVVLAGLSAAQYLFGIWQDVPLGASYLGTTALAGITLALALADQTWHRQRELDAARHAAQTDALSGALNRRALESRLAAAFEDAKRRMHPLSVLFIDLDHFKSINDRYGHAVGDRCLRAIIEPIQAELRASDVLGRWGGEEFVVMLPGAASADARRVAERIRERIESLSIDSEAGPVALTASIGVSCHVAIMKGAEDLVAAADRALYGAKRAGRNRVVMDDDLRTRQFESEVS